MTECGLSNLATCIPEKLFEYILTIVNAPFQPLLDGINALMTQPVNIHIFEGLWVIIIYILSMFYGLFLLFAGFNFMISGYDAVKRENAKEWLKNTVLMILFVQASFLIYELIIEVGALLAAGVMDIIDPHFFLLTADSITNIGLELLLGMFYGLVLVITVIFLALRYLLVAVGVLFFPFALFFYFIPPLQEYGKALLNILLVIIFVPFFNALVLFAASALLDLPVFDNFKIVLMISAFLLINLLSLFLIILGMFKATTSAANSDAGKAIGAAVKYFA
ncbi:hypothetical protein JW868_01100 [Candidatus Woesearchaeota archaeon]|nr:hypothetical protein [Candidatus Woesearchaeota archaeon]